MTRPRIVLAVTHPVSLRLMDGLPAHLSSNYDVHIVVGQDAGGVEGATTHNIPMRRDPAPRDDLVSLLRWVRALRRLRPDILVSGTPKAGLLGMLAGWLVGVPRRIYWLRGLRAETATGFQRLVLLALERVAVAASTEVLVVSHSLAGEATRLRLGPARKFVVLGSGSSNGVDTDRFAAVARSPQVIRGYGLDPDLPTVGFVGRITEDKGVATLAQALIELKSAGPLQLLAVGREEAAGLRTKLSEQLATAAVPHAFIDHIDDIAPAYAAMDMLCLPSLREGFPNVVIEAAACGVPAVCSDATGCRDAVVDGVTGRLFRAGDPIGLADRLGDLLADEERRAQLGAAARRRVLAEFDRATVWGHLNKFLDTEPTAIRQFKRSRARRQVDAVGRQGET